MEGVSEISGTDSDGDSGDEEDKPTVYRVSEGDFVIMVSDGVYDAFCDKGQPTLQKFIAALDTLNPQQMADMILTEANLRSNGARDDMTVLVTRLW